MIDISVTVSVNECDLIMFVSSGWDFEYATGPSVTPLRILVVYGFVVCCKSISSPLEHLHYFGLMAHDGLL